MSFNSINTLSQIDGIVAGVNCCMGKQGFAMVDNIQRGIKNCDCQWEKLFYLNGAKEVLENYIPPDAIVNEGQRAIAPFAVPYNLASLSTVTVKIGSTTIYSDAGPFNGTRLMIEDIVANVTTPYVATSDAADHIAIYSPNTGYYNALIVTISYYDNYLERTITQTAVMSNGQYVRTEAMNCLTPAQIQNIIETVTQRCGCSDCVQNVDGPPQPGAVIVTVPSIYPLTIKITAADFVGMNYTPTGIYSLVGKTDAAPHPNFRVYSDDGSGTLLSQPLGYTFSGTGISAGVLIFPAPGNFYIEILS